ncbi:MAG: DUF3574 domain-containing protein [Blastocatellia bacterium]
MKPARKILLFIAVFSLSFAPQISAAKGLDHSRALIVTTGKFIRTELYFGLTKPDGTTLNDAEWSLFVDEVVTPRFPDGFTVVDGRGQWRNKEGKIAKESSKVFIVVYPRIERVAAGKKIDEIRNEYKKRFDQESVLRVDFTKSIEVSF